MKTFKFFESAVSWLESSKKPFTAFIIVFALAISLRNILEVFSTGVPMDLGSFAHYSLSYACLALAFFLVFRLATGENPKKIAKIILPCFLALEIAPLADLFLSGGKGYAISYFIPGVHDNLAARFLSFFGEFQSAGITPGMRLEIAIILAASFGYFFIKNNSTLKSTFYTLVLYIILFLYGSILFMVKAIQGSMGIAFFASDYLLSNTYLAISFILLFPAARAANETWFWAIVKDSRPFRTAHFELMFALGIAIAFSQGLLLSPETIFAVPTMAISILFACQHVLSSNNIADFKIDSVSNKARPLVSKSIPLKAYKKTSLGFLALALAYALAAGLLPALAIATFTLSYWAYSNSPLRLKKIPILSKIPISFNSLLLVLLGFLMAGGNPSSFPIALAPIFLIFFTLALNFIDLKDEEGDKAERIMTLPVLIGQKKARVLTGIFLFLAYISFFMFLGPGFLPPLAAIGAIQFLLANRKKYCEKEILALYLASISLLIALLFTGVA